MVYGSSTFIPLYQAAQALTVAGARHVVIVEHRCRHTGGSWLTAEVIWRNEHRRLSTEQLAYESWTENAYAMCTRLHVLAAQLRTRT